MTPGPRVMMPSTKRFPFPVELDAVRVETDEQLVERVHHGAHDDIVLIGFADWLVSGRVCYRLEPDLLHALLLTDPPGDLVLAPPHEGFWVELEGLTTLELQGEPVAGFWLTVIETKAVAEDNWVIIATTRTLSDGSHNHFWVSADPHKALDAALTDEDRGFAERLRKIAVLVTLYLMDPAHEETPEPLHGNRAWRSAMKQRGARDPGRLLPFVTQRVLGASYRIPAAATSQGSRLGLRVPVRGHIRMQCVGTGRRDVRATWVRPHWRGPEGGPTSAVVVDANTPSVPHLTEEQRRFRVLEAMKATETKLGRS